MARKLATTKQRPILDVNEGKVITTDIDAEFAKLLLEKRPPNQRPIRQHKVDEYARAMKEGRWRVCFDPIRVNADDEVIDGQHRLLAIVQSGVTMKNALIVTLRDPDAIKSLDQGIIRSQRDQRIVEGRGPMDAAIAAGIIAEKTNWIPIYGRYGREERNELYDNHEYLKDLLQMRSVTKFKRDTWHAGPVSALIRVMRTNKEAAIEFFGSVFKGSGLVYGEMSDVSRLYFRFLVEGRKHHRNVSGMKPVREAAFKGIRAYNLWRTNQTSEYLRYAESMPVPEVADA